MAGRDALNRILSFLLGAAVMVTAGAALLVVTNAVSTGTLAPSDWFREQSRHLDGLTGTDEMIATIIAAAALAIGAVIVLFELAPLMRRERELSVTDANGNTMSLAPETVSLVAEQAAREVSGVLDARMAVQQQTDGVTVSGSVALLEDVNVAEKTNEITQAVKSALQDRLGVKVARLAMKMRLATAAQMEKSRGREHEPYPYREKAGSAH